MQSLLFLGIGLGIVSLLGPAAAAEKGADTASMAMVVIIRPRSLTGGPAAMVAAQGRMRRTKAPRRTLSIPVQPGTYDCYGAASSKPAATLTLGLGQRIWCAAEDDAASLAAVSSLRKGASEREAVGPSAERGAGAGSAAAPEASVILVRSDDLFGGEKATVYADGKRIRAKTGRGMLELSIRPCRIAAYSGISERPGAVVNIDSGRIMYIVNRSSGASQRQLGDLFFASNNRKGALTLYRRALEADTGLIDLCRRIADLAIAAGDRREAVKALRRLAAAGRADARAYHELGDLLAAANNNAEAKRMYDRALAIAGENAAVLEKLANVKARTRDWQGAAAAYEQAARLRPDTLRLYRLAGDMHLKQRDTLKAVAAYRNFLDKGGKSAAAALAVGAYEHRRAYYEDAARYLALVKGKPAQSLGCLRMLGESYFRLGTYAQAVAPLRTAANKYPRSTHRPAIMEMLIEAHASLGEYAKAGVWIGAYAKSGGRQSPAVAYYRALVKEQTSPAAAMTLYDRNIKAYPKDYRNYLRYGVILSADANGLDKALGMLKKAVALADTAPEAWLAIARVYRKLNRPGEELRALEVFAATHPQHPEAAARMAELKMGQGDVQEAMEQLRSVEQDSEDPAILKALARGYAQTGKNDRAIETLERAKKAAPGDTAVRLRLVALYRAMGMTDKVLEEYRGLTQVTRDNALLMTYARLLHENARNDEAASAIEDIRATDPENIDALMLLGAVLRAQEKRQEAVKVYEEIVFIDPSYYRALYERAETHLESGQPHWAEAFYRRALQRNPKYAPAELGLAKVAKLRRNRASYRQHLGRAYNLAPRDPAILLEREESQRIVW